VNLRKDHYLEFVGFACYLLPLSFAYPRFLGRLACRLDKFITFLIFNQRLKNLIITTFNNGSLGSGIDEERSEMR
jgi:hypothetical protein